MSFDPQNTDFNADTAIVLAKASLYAYEDPTEAKKLYQTIFGPKLVFEPFQHHNFVIDTQGYLVGNDKHLILAFRGTEPGKIKDWATDVLAAPSDFRWFFKESSNVGTVHAGFANSLCDAWKESILAFLKKRQAGVKRQLWITGHSLGGALAVLAAAACKFDGGTLLPVAGIYTFGQPRVGLHEFCLHLDAKLGRNYYRFVNHRDIVPRVPPRAFDYTHTGRLIYFDSDGLPSTQSQEQQGFLAKAFQSIADVLGDITHATKVIADHSMDKHYLPLVEKLATAAIPPALHWS